MYRSTILGNSDAKETGKTGVIVSMAMDRGWICPLARIDEGILQETAEP